jgi:hypothetical protein
MHRPRSVLMTSLLLLLLIGNAFAHHDHGSPESSYVARDTTGSFLLEGPEQLPAGYNRISLVNTTNGPRALQILKFHHEPDERALIESIEAIIQRGDGEGLFELIEAYGGLGVGPGDTGAVTVSLDPGHYAFTVLGQHEGQALASLGYLRMVSVINTENAVTQPPHFDLSVDMLDFAFTLPERIPSGPLTWKVANLGEQIHHLILFRLAPGKTMEDVQAFMQTYEGEPPAVEVTPVEILSSGRSNYVTYDLEPGTYFAACFLPTPPSGIPHVALGMISAFVAGE